jgi:phosphatidylglycerol:prolipoprotein diacylglycerol transferase
MIVSVTALILYMKKKKLPVLKTSDFMIVALPLGHALGRIGCFLAGCCYGRPTNLPWGVTFTDPHSLVPPELLGTPLHPTQLYEACFNFLLFLLLHKLYQRPHKDGSILVCYVACYGFLRFFIEFFRGDFRGAFWLGLSPSQLIAIIISLIAGALWLRLAKKDPSHG